MIIHTATQEHLDRNHDIPCDKDEAYTLCGLTGEDFLKDRDGCQTRDNLSLVTCDICIFFVMKAKTA